MKKQLSIKARITLWFAVFMVLLAALALVFLLLSGNTLLRRDAESVLTETVEHNAANLVYTDGQLSLGEQFQFYTNGVYTVIYDTPRRLTRKLLTRLPLSSQRSASMISKSSTSA